jgi:hypothetical protein
VHLCDKPDRHFRSSGASPETVLAVDLPAVEVTDAQLDPLQMPDCCDYIVPANVIHAVGHVTILRDG